MNALGIPAMLLVHTVAVETKQGDGAYGESYAASVDVACFCDYQRRLVRTPDGDQVTSGATIYTELGKAAVFAAGSRVTLPDGTTTTVIDSRDLDDGGLGAPQHTEVVCQ